MGIKTLVCLFVIALASPAWGGPFLVCDPTSQEITICELEINGVVEVGTCETVDTETRFHHDLAGLTIGTYSARVRWRNIWDWSDWSPFFEFTKAIPNPVSGIGLEE